MIPGPPALCEGIVVHRRSVPERHSFTYPITNVWFDPDHPESLCDLHPAWSSRHIAPARYRREDYGTQPTGSLCDMARSDLATALGRPVNGPVRILTQIRRWGWLFNPITIYFVWDSEPASNPGDESISPTPVGAVLEVTNTPWKERHRYPVLFAPKNVNGDRNREKLTAEFDKSFHVSPFLGMSDHYRVTVDDRDDRIAISVDVVDDQSSVILHTSLHLNRRPATRKVLQRSLFTAPFPTHRVSAGIHRQALALWAKRVPFRSHPKRPSSPSASCNRTTEETTP